MRERERGVVHVYVFYCVLFFLLLWNLKRNDLRKPMSSLYSQRHLQHPPSLCKFVCVYVCVVVAFVVVEK